MAAFGCGQHGALLGGSEGSGSSSSEDDEDGQRTSLDDGGGSSDGEANGDPRRISDTRGTSRRYSAFRESLDLEKVLEEEAAFIRDKRALLQQDPCQTFSLAFSGGGVRAAAFQSGVLWRLAEKNMMQNIDCFSAVSGGGYVTSALASHIIEKELRQGRPEPGAAREWYLDAVCSTILRMQRNAGDFVRDGWRRPGIPQDGAGICPRILDLPLLIFMLIVTLLINPLSFLILVVVPVTVAIELHYGAAMRAAFCAPVGTDWIEVYWLYSDFARLVSVPPVSVAVTFVAFVLHKTCFSKKRYKSGAVSANGFLLAKYSAAALSRFTVLFLLFIVILFLVPALQLVSNGVNGCKVRKRQCVRYIDAEMLNLAEYRSSQLSNHRPDQKELFTLINGLIDNGTDTLDSCVDLHWGRKPWYTQEPFINLASNDFCSDGVDITRNITKQNGTAEYPNMDHSSGATLRIIDSLARRVYEVFLKDNHDLIAWFFALVVMALIGAIVAMPFTGSYWVAAIAWSAGPCLLFLVLLAFIQFRVFAPLTSVPFLGLFHWDRHRWQVFATSCFAISLFVPMYQELRSIWHAYYRYSLQKNFFAGGRDRLLCELRESACCPHVVVTGTVNDCRTVGAKQEDSIAEISFSSLHMGSNKLGYSRSPRWESLSKLTALTGAGCLDAAALSLSRGSDVKLRFWLEVLNLSWGDYVLFGEHQGHSWRCVEGVGSRITKRCPSWEGLFMYAAHRMTPGLTLCVVYLLMNVAWHLKSADMASTCRWARVVSITAFALMLLMLALSFFAFCPALQWTMFSPWIRQIHQGIAHHYEGPAPPGFLYVTDGGVADCTTLVQLMMRGSERILLVLAAADPNDELGVLRAAMEVARKEKIGGFFDPTDERRDVNVLFDEFKNSRDKTWMHVGIRYGWDGPEKGRKLGHLVIVKNRLPDQFKSRPCHSLLTEDEIKHGKTARPPSEDEATQMNSDELGPWGCCDCCHGLCNCGPKFPHGNFAGYLYLTPAWFNELCRLGYDMSEEAVDALFTLNFAEGPSEGPHARPAGQQTRTQLGAAQREGPVGGPAQLSADDAGWGPDRAASG